MSKKNDKHLYEDGDEEIDTTDDSSKNEQSNIETADELEDLLKQAHTASESEKGEQKKSRKDKKADKKTELETLQEQCAEYLEGWKRAQADYQNLQKETTTRISENIKYANTELLLSLLPMVDHFKYAFKGIPVEERESSWLKGIEYIQSNFMKILEEHGLEMTQTVGQPFDQELHEAVEELTPENPAQSGTIAEEMTSGFTLNGKIIQIAKVKVYE